MVAASANLVAATERLTAAATEARASGDAEGIRRINQALLRVARQIVPLNYSSVAPHEHDLALPLPAVPCLRGANDLAVLDPASDAYKFRRAEVMRACNRVIEAIDEATSIIDSVA